MRGVETDIEFAHQWQGETVKLAVKRVVPAGNDSTGAAGFVWLGGFRSDMTGSKATTMVEQAAQMHARSLRFDYSGHGASGGAFENGTISRWVAESLAVIRELTEGPQILLGSSMGGWIALRVVQELAAMGESDRVAGLLLIAPAPDFTVALMEPSFSDDEREQMREQGFIAQESAYSEEPNIITRQLIEDGRRNLVLDKELTLACPVHVLQGMRDPDVPYTHAMRLVEQLVHDEVMITLVKDGDHRLSSEADLELLRRTMQAMSEMN